MDRPDGHLPARVISGMRITIPDEFRDDIEEGDRVWVNVEPWDESEDNAGWIVSD